MMRKRNTDLIKFMYRNFNVSLFFAPKEQVQNTVKTVMDDSFLPAALRLAQAGRGFEKVSHGWPNLRILAFIIVAIFLFSFVGKVEAVSIPTVNIEFGESDNPKEVAASLKVLFLLTILSLAPGLLIMTTSFSRIIIVLSFLRQALGTQQMPPNQILVGLALFLSFFIMSPLWNEVNTNALQPYLSEKISQPDALTIALKPMRKFMFNQTRPKDLAMFISMSKMEKPRNRFDVPTHVLIPAFIISELKTAFQIGFLIYIPFLILDMVVASVLLSMGMMMLPPVMISLPFKLMLFVLVDGWYLIVGSLMKSFSL